MTNNTIGSFIATLRKANGMTQRDLAERLNVSDKTVSRWERDEGAPDLSLIPVIAELFGVSCDELLRGERKPVQQRVEPDEERPGVTPKGEKAMKRLLQVALYQYNTRTIITVAIAVIGVVAALIANSFHRAHLGFEINCIFVVIALLCQAIFINRALLAISTDELPESEILLARRSIYEQASRVFRTIAMTFVATLPLILLVTGPYYGLRGGTWLLQGSPVVAAVWVLWLFIHDILMLTLLRRGIIAMGEHEAEALRHNVRLKKRCTLLLAVLLAVTGSAHGILANLLPAHRMAEAIEFNDYQSFADYMAIDAGSINYSTSVERVDPNYGPEVTVAPIEVVTESDPFKHQLTLKDGTVVLEYVHNNHNVGFIRYTEKDGSLLPIQVVTDDAVRAASVWVGVRNVAFCVLYAVEAAIVLVIYYKRRAK